jgi:hypothetical protein
MSILVGSVVPATIHGQTVHPCIDANLPHGAPGRGGRAGIPPRPLPVRVETLHRNANGARED